MSRPDSCKERIYLFNFMHRLLISEFIIIMKRFMGIIWRWHKYDGWWGKSINYSMISPRKQHVHISRRRLLELLIQWALLWGCYYWLSFNLLGAPGKSFHSWRIVEQHLIGIASFTYITPTVGFSFMFIDYATNERVIPFCTLLFVR